MTTQSAFRAALLTPDAPIPDGLGNTRPNVKRRYAVYRNNVTVALQDALRASFPVLEKLLGAQNFEQLAQIFLRQHPPSTPLMMYYGEALPAFLQDFEPLSHIGYLPDVAHLEIALRSSYHAADAPPFDPQTLSACDPDKLDAFQLHFAPATTLVMSQWPLYDIWRFNTQADAPKPQAIAQSVLITRAEYDPTPQPLTPAQTAWVQAVQAGKTLGQAQQDASAVEAEFDLNPLLITLLQTGAFCASIPRT